MKIISSLKKNKALLFAMAGALIVIASVLVLMKLDTKDTFSPSSPSLNSLASAYSSSYASKAPYVSTATAVHPALQDGIITDPDTMSWLWDYYIQDSIGYLQADFPSLEKNADAKYRYIEYVFELLLRSKLRVNPFETNIAPPDFAETKNELVRYFNSDLGVTQADYTDAFELYNRRFPINSGTGSADFSSIQFCKYNSNSLGRNLDEASYDQKSGTYTIKIYSYSPDARLYGTCTKKLAQRTKTELYFVSIKNEYPDVHYVKIDGNYKPLNSGDLRSYHDNYFSPIFAQLDNNKLLIEYNSSAGTKDVVYCIYNPDTDKIEKSYKVNSTKEKPFLGIRITADKIIFKFKQSFYCTDYNLEPIKGTQTDLPETVLNGAKAYAAIVDGEYGPDASAAYDVTSDMQKIAYCDDKGLNIFDVTSGTSALLFTHLVVNDRHYKIAYVLNPIFTFTDKSIYSALTGFTGGGHGNLVTGITQNPVTNVILQGMGNPGYIAWNTIMYKVPNLKFTGTSGNNSTSFNVSMQDLDQTAQAGKIVLSEEKPVPYSYEKNQIFINNEFVITITFGKYLAYIVRVDDNSQTGAKEKSGIVLLNLETLEAKTVATLNKGYPTLHAITSDGRVLFSYEYESEFGFVLTEK